jgi:hypothetical protein
MDPDAKSPPNGHFWGAAPHPVAQRAGPLYYLGSLKYT